MTDTARVAPSDAAPGHMLLLALACAVLGLGVWTHGLPLARAGCCFTPDTVEYVASAHNWLEGAGFVDPILFSNYLPDAHPPVPTFAVRAPGMSVLLMPPLALGANLEELLVWHLAWASVVAVFMLLVARRSMSLPAAMGFAIAVSWSPVWMLLSPIPLTEVSSVAMLVLAIASVRSGTASVRGALLLALLTTLAWMLRPNLALILPATLLAVAIELGPRATLRHRPLWAYVASFVILNRAITWTTTAATGFAPYAHYGLMAEIIRVSDAFLYGKEFVGWLPFLEANRDVVLASLANNLQQLTDTLFVRDRYLWVGWLGVPGIAFALLRRGEGSLERRFAAFAALGFLVVAVAAYGGYDGLRYPIFGAVCMWFTAMAMLDAAAIRAVKSISARWPTAGLQRAAVLGVPLVVALMLYGNGNGAESGWDGYRQWKAAGERRRPLCSRIAWASVVASQNPWWLYLACGNPGYRLPIDLAVGDTLDRYLDERQPRYLLVPAAPQWSFLAKSSRLEPVARVNGLLLFEVPGATSPNPPWRAPRPLLAIR